ncbi:MAG: hypothetical protein ABIP74_00785 [Candidatus Saccharimonas sp.]
MTEHPQPKNLKRKSRLIKIGALMGGLALVLAIALMTMLIMKSQSMQQVDTNKYQVVYLTNGQAYFGKLQNTNGEYLVIKTPYTVQTVAPATDSKTTTDQSTTTLLKVSAQVYGPEDSIAVKASQVTFWQNLRDDSKITQAIKAKE